MELVMAAIAAGGLVGASNQYACLLVLGLAARFGWVQLAGPMGFMGEWWFIGVVGVLWLVTIAPALSAQFAPGLMHAVNALVHFVSGFVVPLSAALVALASVGIIVNLSPELQAVIEALKIFNGETGALGATGVTIAAGSAVAASALTGMKALAKPMLSTASGTAGTASAPAFAIAENLAAVALMGLAYALSQIDPWLLAGLWLWYSGLVNLANTVFRMFLALPLREQFTAVTSFSISIMVFSVVGREFRTDRMEQIAARMVGASGVILLVAFAYRMTLEVEDLQQQIAARADKVGETAIAYQVTGIHGDVLTYGSVPNGRKSSVFSALRCVGPEGDRKESGNAGVFGDNRIAGPVYSGKRSASGGGNAASRRISGAGDNEGTGAGCGLESSGGKSDHLYEDY